MSRQIGFFVLLAALLGLSADAFIPAQKRAMLVQPSPAAASSPSFSWCSVTNQPLLLQIPLRASLVEQAEDKEDTSSNSATDRRSFLVGTIAAATAAAGITSSTTANLPLLGSNNNVQTLATVADAIQWIDDHCDRRFLHAVVASDYRFLYRGVDTSNNSISIRREAPDLLSPETYGPEALPFFQKLETLLQDEPVHPSNGHLATTSAQDAAAWGTTAASIWPMGGGGGGGGDAHYAWFQDGGLFYPRGGKDAALVLDRKSIIVDGRDCGKDSLEDALRGDSWEIMVATPAFLAVPVSKENELRERLRNSFLV